MFDVFLPIALSVLLVGTTTSLRRRRMLVRERTLPLFGTAEDLRHAASVARRQLEEGEPICVLAGYGGDSVAPLRSLLGAGYTVYYDAAGGDLAFAAVMVHTDPTCPD